MPERVHPSWQIATEVGEQMAIDRREAEKQATKGVPYGKEYLEPMEMAKRFLEAGLELKVRMLKDMRQPRDGMSQVRKFIKVVRVVKRRATPGPRPPQLRI